MNLFKTDATSFQPVLSLKQNAKTGINSVLVLATHQARHYKSSYYITRDQSKMLSEASSVESDPT